MGRPASWLIVSLALLPGVVVLVGLGGVPGGAGAWLDLLGRLAGVLGLACLVVAMLVSVRVPGFDRPCGGLTRLWKLHHYLGLACFLLLLAHPLLMALSRVPLSRAAVLPVLLPGAGQWALWAGWIALVALVVFLAPSFQLFGRPAYPRWKALHFLSGLALAAGLVHTLPLTRSLSGPVAAVLWGTLGGLAVAVFVWRAALARRVLRRPWRLVENRLLADGVTQLYLEPEDGRRLAHEPGQFVYLTPHDPGLAAGRDEEHPYTVSSAPGAPRLELTVKDLGDASAALLDAAAGSPASIEGPYGDFLSPRFRSRRQLWIGGGVGITPFVGAARARAANARTEGTGGGGWGDTVLVNCANDPSRAYLLDVLAEAAEGLPDLSVHPHYFADEGPLTLDFVLERCPDAALRDWFVCGPPPLVRLAHRLAGELGVPRRRFHAEDFAFL